ncbi:hypothetical protein CAPTEDRAFT_194555 [Capitella teleta]|uniref:Uncharacterized protein n=1 Tax=Capitella teleta TaxID=283909 RepID=R7UDS9_CAPTE|nr:hypothetical protein CAPTEDRAFT_194555 [Capitella teleta]|eukprot:ELU04266.1 hypothetical protein CAPTEDRAFT_194555 [Capitella teleta]
MSKFLKKFVSNPFKNPASSSEAPSSPANSEEKEAAPLTTALRTNNDIWEKYRNPSWCKFLKNDPNEKLKQEDGRRISAGGRFQTTSSFSTEEIFSRRVEKKLREPFSTRSVNDLINDLVEDPVLPRRRAYTVASSMSNVRPQYNTQKHGGPGLKKLSTDDATLSSDALEKSTNPTELGNPKSTSHRVVQTKDSLVQTARYLDSMRDRKTLRQWLKGEET